MEYGEGIQKTVDTIFESSFRQKVRTVIDSQRTISKGKTFQQYAVSATGLDQIRTEYIAIECTMVAE